ncbi:AAA family ATPase [Nesterenkonia aurantiaca]|uniref:AAA family ATPase n=1 Tax=Nesterenkonia aurantiaca TaxID=1436010 RepID=UPI003EE567A4
MPNLVLINGAPASGKSTLARLLALDRDLTLVLDIDTIRGLLTRWEDDPTIAGYAARRLALSMCRAHLSEGNDVVVPQFLQREEFILELASVASDTEARFHELCLINSPERASAMFAARASSDEPNHLAAKLLQEDSGADPVSRLYETLIGMVSARPQTLFVESIFGDIGRSLENLRAAMGQAQQR